MNAKRIACGASRPSRFLIFALLLLSPLAGLLPQAQASIGDALTLRSLLSAARVKPAAPGNASPAGYRNLPNGRTLINHSLLRSGALRGNAATTANTVPIPNATQTFDIGNPLPAFEPLLGYGTPTNLTNDTTNSAVFIKTLTPTNLTPVWSADQTFIVFSSNRTVQGGVQPDGRFHLWAIPASGGEAYQITGDSNPDINIRGEFFPALSANNSKLAFVSDGQSPGTRNLFVLGASVAGTTSAGGFSFNALVAYNNAQLSTTNPPYQLDVSKSDPRSNGIASVTLRSTNQTISSSQTGFGDVQRPTFSPGNDGLVVFSAFSTTGFPNSGTNGGHYHLYFLYTNSLGFDPNNNFSFPGKLTDGPADDTDPAWSQDGQFIAFASTATSVANNPQNSFGPNPPTNTQDPNQSQSLTAAPAGTTVNSLRSLFLISGGGSGTASGFGVVPNALVAAGGRVTAAGSDNFGPAWSYITLSARNQYINPAPGFQYLAFARATSQAAAHDIYYLQTVRTASTSANADTVLAEGTAVGTTINTVVKLNTDDTGNVYDDIYPTWSPFLSLFSIAYTSNRTVTYNDPATANPSEVAISVPQGGTANTSDPTTSSYTVGAGYNGIFQSQVLNLDPPTLLRFAPDQVLHIQAAGAVDANNQSLNPVTGTSNKLAVTGNQNVTITVRLSNREAGIDDNKVFLQIKDPDSKYQDAQGREHKVFSRDRQFIGQTNRPISETNSGTADGSNGSFGLAFNGFGGFEFGPNVRQGGRYDYPSYIHTNPDVTYVGDNAQPRQTNPRGTHGGHYFFDPNGANPNNPNDTYVYVGKNSINPNTGQPNTGGPTGGGDPALFIPVGAEYECQFVNPQFITGGGGTDTLPTDYRSPYYLAGVDDQRAFSGSARPPRPTANTTDANGNVTAPAEYLQMVRVPQNKQDNKGGVLYTVTWRTPASASDFYLDVIAYDKAVFPTLPAGTSNYDGQKFNFRIYDNVGGFSTQQTLPNNDILVVSDYALGQKFAATTFGGQNTNQNLIPKQFGTESYLTDVDVSILPDRSYMGVPTSVMSYNFNAALNPFLGSGTPTQVSGGFQYYPGGVRHQNGLGVGSYYDSAIDDGGRDSTSGVPFVNSQKYTIWRILSRGPVPDTLLQSYQPTAVSQPAIVDPATNGAGTVPAQLVLDAHRCIVWLAPYTGSLLVDPGTLDDLDLTGVPNVNNRVRTQQALRSFVANGGRLCITGQDVGSTLTLGGVSGNTPGGFLPDVLNASFNPAQTGTTTLNGTNNRIFGNALFDGSTGSFNSGGVQYLSMVGSFATGFRIVNVGNGGTFPYQDRLRLSSNDQNDGSYDEVPATRLPTGASIQGQPDVITPLNAALVGATYDNGGNALVFHDDPFGKVGTGGTAGQLPNGGTGSRTVYAAFNLGALSQDYYSSGTPDPSQTPAYDLLMPDVIPRNVRPAVIHNVVSYLRTGFITGKITQTAAGNGQNANSGVPGATVYVQDINGQTPSSRAVFSATTSQSGDFVISGVEPGTYRVIAYKNGYTRAVSNGNVSFTVEGDTTAANATLTINPVPPGNIAGIVVDNTGATIPGATVTITSQDNTVTRTTTTFDGTQAGQTKGGFLFSSVPVTTYTVATATGPLNNQGTAQYTGASKADAPFDTSIVVQSGVTTGDGTVKGGVTFTLTQIGAIVKGRVYSGATPNDTTGALTKGGAVQAFASAADAADPAAKPLATATIGVDGTYNLTNILPVASFPGTASQIVIKASAPGFTSQTFTVALFLGDVLTDQNVALTAILPGSITGTVTYATGGAVANAAVTFTPAGSTAPLTATTNAAGSYTIAAPAGTYAAAAVGMTNKHNSPTTNAPAAVNITVQPGTALTKNFTLTLIPPTVQGTVFDSASGVKLQNALITVTDVNTGKVIGTTLTDAKGIYSSAKLPLVDGGTYTIVASKAAYQSTALLDPFTPGSTSTQITFYNGDTLLSGDFALPMLLPGTISGTVFDNLKAVVPGATVTFTSTDGAIKLTAVTDGKGAYSLPMAGAPAGDYSGTVTGPLNTNGKPQYTAPTTATPVTVSPNTPAVANFTLTQILPTFAVTVTDAAGGAAITNATVTFTPAAGGATTTVTTNVAGVYTSPGLAPGTYTITATANGFFDGVNSAGVELGDSNTPVALVLNEKATVYGLITDSVSGAALSGVTITVTNSGVGTAVTTTPSTITTGTSTSNGPDGGLQNYTFSLPPGTYTLTATKANYTQSISAAFTVKNALPVRVDLKLTSSIGTIGGLVTDAVANSITPVGGATVNVMNAAGTVVASFTTSTATSTGGDGKAVNYTGQVIAGKYTVTVTKGTRKSAPQTVTVLGGTFNRVDFTGPTNGLPALYVFQAGLQFFSTPYDYSGLGFNGLFGALNTSAGGSDPNGNRSHVAVWDPVAAVYKLDPTAPADTVRLGQGYWVFLKNAVPVTQQGTTAPAGFVPQPLNPTWNMIGVPNPNGVPVSSLMFDNGAGGKITYAQASTSQYAILTPGVTNIYRYDSASNTYQPVSDSAVLSPWTAYWLRVRVPATLEIPTGTSTTTTPTTPTTATGVPGTP